MSDKDYGELCADAAADGFDSPEARTAARYLARLVGEEDIYFPHLEADEDETQHP